MERSVLAGTNTLVLYNERETFTGTLYEHLSAFARYSQARVFFAHQLDNEPVSDFALFDTVVIHYSVRLPFNQIAEETAQALEGFAGLKVLFIQDEYDHTHRAWYWMKRLGIHLVFSSVPAESLTKVYPPDQLPGIRFVSNLTGYAPDGLAAVPAQPPPSERPLKIGYRGRPLPIRYGALGREKVEIGRMVKAYCESAGIAHDIEWAESARLYGDAWTEFIASCRAMLGTESGSNVFDWDGTLPGRIVEYKQRHPGVSDDDLYTALIAPLDHPGLMNQVSARVFEAIACRTPLVLFEGRYSGVVIPDRHFIPLRKDGSNLPEIVERLKDGRELDAMTERAYDEVLRTGRYGHEAFVRMVDDAFASEIKRRGGDVGRHRVAPVSGRPLITRSWPNRVAITKPASVIMTHVPEPVYYGIIRPLLPLLPRGLKDLVKRVARAWTRRPA